MTAKEYLSANRNTAIYWLKSTFRFRKVDLRTLMTDFLSFMEETYKDKDFAIVTNPDYISMAVNYFYRESEESAKYPVNHEENAKFDEERRQAARNSISF